MRSVIHGPRAWGKSLTIDWHVTDVDERYFMELSNGALIHFPTGRRPKLESSQRVLVASTG
jgi:alkyl sulfatase BDS1-like metallo-beta-lactamase superfamily hydrolase